jgi:polysaccharide export outer membrane protein
LLLLAVLLISSCGVTKKTVYFNDIADTTGVRKLTPAVFEEPVILPDDIVRIQLQTLAPEAPVTDATSVNYLVDKEGFVQLPLIGALKIAGLTTIQARELVREKAAKYYQSPTVQLQLTNFKVTVLGEVARPAVYTMPNERVTLLDALGLAGDLTIYGKRSNVLLVRSTGAQKEFVRFNLNSSSIYQSPYFYLKQNDMIYVEPGKGKIAANNTGRTQAIAIIGSVVSVLIVALSRL